MAKIYQFLSKIDYNSSIPFARFWLKTIKFLTQKGYDISKSEMELLFQNTFYVVSHGNLAYFVFDLRLEGLQTIKL